MSLPRVFAIVPAAGRSRRMGTAKQLLDVAGRPMLRGVLETLAASELEGIVLVTHTGIAQTVSQWQPARTHVTLNNDETSEMIDSIRLGLDAWSRQVEFSPRDGVLIYPADQPGITPSAIDACIDAFRINPNRIIVASHAGWRGHPLIFPAALIPFARSRACAEGLNALPQAHPNLVQVVECDSPAVTRDLDTPADYRRLTESEHPD